MPTLVKAPIKELVYCTDNYLWTFETDFNPALHGNFDPTLLYSGGGSVIWRFENGEVLTGASISTTGTTQGLDGTVQTVIVEIPDPTAVTGIDFNTDRIYGTLSIPSDFTNFTALNVNTNPTLTDISLGGNSATWTQFYAFSCNLTGTLNLSSCPNMGGDFRVHSNANLTGITFPAASPTLWSTIRANNCNLSSCNITNCVTNSTTLVQLNNNTNMTSFTRASSMTVNGLLLNFCRLSTFSFTGITFAGSNPFFQINNQQSNVLTSITGTPTGSMNLFRIDSNINLVSPSTLPLGSLTWTGSNQYLNFEATGFTSVDHGASTGTLRTYQFGAGPNFTYWSLGSLALSTSGLLFEFDQSPGMSVGNVNNWFTQLDGLLGAGTGTIRADGTTPAATGAGITAANSLVSKGYTVIRS